MDLSEVEHIIMVNYENANNDFEHNLLNCPFDKIDKSYVHDSLKDVLINVGCSIYKNIYKLYIPTVAQLDYIEKLIAPHKEKLLVKARKAYLSV